MNGTWARWRVVAASVFSMALLTGGCLEGAVPTLLPLEPVLARVNETLHVSLGVDNPEGLALDYSFSPSPALASLNMFAVASVVGTPNGGEFTWAPLASHVGTHQITLSVASRNGVHSQTLLVTVNPAATAAPIFLAPGSGGTYDLAQKSCIKVAIEVKDDDSPEVAIRSRETLPAGGSLTTTDPKRARFDWCPTSAQSQESQRWTLALEADDLEHTPTQHDYVMVLRTVTKASCSGSAPQVTVLSPGPGESVASPSGYPVTILVMDENAIKEAPILYWTTKAPQNPDKPDLGLFEQALFEPGAGAGTWTAVIPPLGLESTAAQTLWFFASVVDNDDATGTACDHRTDTAVQSFQASSGFGGVKAGLCELCASSAGCASNVCVTSADGARCLVDCVPGGPTCAQGICAQVTTVDGGLVMACGGVAEVCGFTSGEEICINDGYEPNDEAGLAASLWATTQVSATVAGMICPGDEDHFVIAGDPATDLAVEVTLGGFDTTQDLDLSVGTLDGGTVATSAGTTAQEIVSYCLSAFDSATVRVYPYKADSQTSYHLTATVSPSTCCENDANEPDDTFFEATQLPVGGGAILGVLCPSDQDMYTVVVSEPSLLSAEVSYTTTSGYTDLDLEIVDSGGVILEYAWNDGPTETIETFVAEAGTYAVRVVPWGQDEVNYSGMVTVGAGGGSSCASTKDCVMGTVCSTGGCVSSSCNVGTDCPAGHGCVVRENNPPPPGLSDRICVAPCVYDADCRLQDGERCKKLPEGSFCAVAGAGDTGDGCASFEECAGDHGCFPWTGGYCAVAGCVNSWSCAVGTFCMTGNSAGETLCALACGAGTGIFCREAEGYYCSYTVNTEGDLAEGCMQIFVFDI